MRCDLVARELTVPSGRLDAAALAGHLDACASCSALAAKADRLDLALAATRSPAPDPLAFERLWAGVSRSLESGAAEPGFSIEPEAVPELPPAVLPMPSPGRWQLSVALLGPLAVAAALVLAIGLPRIAPIDSDGPPPVAAGTPNDPDPGSLALALFEVDIEHGEPTLIHMGGAEAPRVQILSDLDDHETDEIPAILDILNTMESLSAL